MTDRRQRLRVVAARRLPGRPFAAPEPVTGWWTTDTFGDPDPEVGIDAGGTGSVVWSRGNRRGFEQTTIVAVAAPGAGFTHQRLARGSDHGQSVAIAVAPDGWSVVAHAVDESGLAVFERPPGSPQFTRVPTAARSDAYAGVEHPTVAVADGGGAVVAWRTEPADEGRGVAATTRAPGGAFAEPQVIVPAREPSSGRAVAVLVAGGSPPFDLDADRPRVVIGADGRVLLAWTGLRGRLATYRARIATGRLGSGFDAAQDVSRSVRDADAVAPLFLADGRAAVAWVDNTSGNRDGRLHVAVEGAPAPASAAPRLTLRYEPIQRLFPSQPVRVVATCDRPCDVTGAIRGGEDVAVTRLAAGSVALELPRSWQFDAPHFRFGAITADVHASEPGGTAIARQSVRVRAVRRPPPPLLRPLDVRARRRGDRIIVSWRTAGPARRMQFSAFGQRTRNMRTIEISAADLVAGRGRTRFTARLRPDRPARVRWVTVHASSRDRQGARSVTVRVG